MDKTVRGKALILNVQFKDHNVSRKGTDVDRDNLKQLFEQLHLDVTVHNDEDGLTVEVGAKVCIHVICASLGRNLQTLAWIHV